MLRGGSGSSATGSIPIFSDATVLSPARFFAGIEYCARGCHRFPSVRSMRHGPRSNPRAGLPHAAGAPCADSAVLFQHQANSDTVPVMSEETSQKGMAAGECTGETASRVGLRDVLSIDVPKIHGAVTSDGIDATPAAKFLMGILEEHRPRYATRVLYCPPLPLLWGFRGDDSPAAVAHQAYARAVWRERGFVGRAGLLSLYLLWPLIVGAMIVWLTALNGPAVKKRTGKGVLRQAFEELRFAATDAILPPWYYMFELHVDANHELARNYLRRDETKGGLFRLLKRPGPKGLLNNKRRFARHCKRHGVKTPASFVLRKGRVRSVAGPPPKLPPADLFVKPARGQGGRGTEVWKRVDGGWTRDESEVLDEAALLAYFAAISGQEEFLVQPRLANHPDLTDLANGVLSTVRVLTCRDESDGFVATHAVFRMAKTPGSKVDNMHSGGIAAPIDLDTGELGQASDMGLRPESDWWERHPYTGARIQGRKLPCWEEVVDLACRAHAAFPDWTAVGWDIAIVGDGPLVIEGNSGPDVDLVQRPHRAPLGASRFGELLAFHLKHPDWSRASEA